MCRLRYLLCNAILFVHSAVPSRWRAINFDVWKESPKVSRRALSNLCFDKTCQVLWSLPRASGYSGCLLTIERLTMRGSLTAIIACRRF